MSASLLHSTRLLAAVLGTVAAIGVGWYAVRAVGSQRAAHTPTRAHAKSVAGTTAQASSHGSVPAAKAGSDGAFAISGRALGALVPGGPALPVELVVENPAAAPLTVESVTVRVAGTSSEGCGVANFALRQLAATAVVPAHAARSLAQLGIPRSEWPQLRMRETATNQDACAGTVITLRFDGSGRYGR